MPIEIPTEFELEDWIPMMPQMGPPLPRMLGIYWPWYEVPGAELVAQEPLTIYPEEVQIGNPVTISCSVMNIGSESGSKTIELKIGGEVVATKSVTLAPGESEVVSFEVTPDVAKSYSVSANGLYGSFVATTVPVADIKVENLTITPAKVMVGKVVTISCRATNYGGKTGSKVITCNVT